MEQANAAKTVFICFRQLEELLKTVAPYQKERYGDQVHTAKACAPTYNSILSNLKECFGVEPAFARLIEHLRPIQDGDFGVIEKISSEGAVLRGTAHALIEMYLSPEEKKKAIGFQPKP
jgi:hypothetical protein